MLMPRNLSSDVTYSRADRSELRAAQGVKPQDDGCIDGNCDGDFHRCLL